MLVGMMGSGKSTIGRLLAHALGMGFIDTDEQVEAKLKKTIAQTFKQDGEERFREVERQVVRRAATARSHVIAVGGGAVEDQPSWDALRSGGLVVWLNTPVEEVVRRLAPSVHSLPALAWRPLLEDLADTSELRPGSSASVSHEFLAERRRKLTERLKALQGARLFRYRESDFAVEPVFETPDATVRNIVNELSVRSVGRSPTDSGGVTGK